MNQIGAMTRSGKISRPAGAYVFANKRTESTFAVWSFGCRVAHV